MLKAHVIRTAVLAALCLWSVKAAADRPQLQIVAQSDLRFGSFAVPRRGSVEVSPAGVVTRAAVVSVTSGDTSPARFTIRYDRGNNGRRRLDLRIQLAFSAPSTFVTGGLEARLSRLQTDLQGYASVAPNQIIEITIPNCRQRVCERTFHVGGKLDIDRQFGGGSISIPIPVDAILVAVK